MKVVGLLRELLAERRGDPDDLVIVRRPGGVPDMLKRAMRSQGITASFHTLRQTYATSETSGDRPDPHGEHRRALGPCGARS